MSDLAIDLHWQRSEPVFATGKYSAQHTVIYNNSYEVLADAAPDWGGRPENTNPEQALTAKAGWPVASDHDYAIWARTPKGKCQSHGSTCIPLCVSTQALASQTRSWSKCKIERIGIVLSPKPSPTV